MLKNNHSRKALLLLGDIIILYLSLFLALWMRKFSLPPMDILVQHLLPFTIVNFIWISIFVIAGFYNFERKIFIGLEAIVHAVVTGMFIAIVVFYLFPFNIEPKTTLILQSIMVMWLIWKWRKVFGTMTIKTAGIKTLFLDGAMEKNSLVTHLKLKPQLGYQPVDEAEIADLVVVSHEAKENKNTIDLLYKMVQSGKTVIDFDKFYETITGKIPVHQIGKEWFVDNLMEINKKSFQKMKLIVDLILTIIFVVPTILLFPFTALAIKLESSGPVLFRQKRVGKNGKIFEVVKFRSMIHESDTGKIGWKKPTGNDNRLTRVGKIIRKTRIDELPQIWNVLRGEISFIGPRPERPEFVAELEKQVPHYSMRHIVKPGLTGWAQIHNSGASAEDAPEKMQYDLYYIKNRSLLLDILILLKTIMIILRKEGR